jgi:phosphoribosylamine--glycine ligase
MNILVVGAGGREHALAWKLSQEANVFACPGNPGIAECAQILPVDASDAEVLKSVCVEHKIDLVVIGPEDPLIAGLADELREVTNVFGPGAAGAELEGSKAFSKDMMARAGVPTAAYKVFTDFEPAEAFATGRFEAGHEVAVKASGAALGKGVIVCGSMDEAEDALRRMMLDKEFGSAGDSVVIEDRLHGREFSLLTIVSGRSYRSLPVAQDYKPAYDGNEGPNTGGMGTYSPVEWLSDDLLERTERTVVEPLVSLMADRGIDYRGILFSGLMVQDGVPLCLEYNVRFGDPETQSVMRRLGSGFADALMAAAQGKEIPEFEVLDNSVVTVVMASGGYPGKYEKGLAIDVPELGPETVVFHAGTKLDQGRVVTAGGRVLGVSASGASIPDARAAAYQSAEQITFKDRMMRSDIALDA